MNNFKKILNILESVYQDKILENILYCTYRFFDEISYDFAYSFLQKVTYDKVSENIVKDTYSDIKNTNHEFLKPEDIFIMFFSKVYNINISDIDNFLSERGVKGTHLSTYSEYDEPMTFEEMIVVFKDINENNEDKEHDIYHVVKSVYENENLITIIVNCYNYLLDISPFLSTYFKENIVKQPFVNKIKTLYKQFEPLTIKPKNFVIGKNIIANIFEISGNKLDFFIDCYIDNTEYYLNLKEIKECDKETEELNTEKNNLTPITFQEVDSISKSFDNPPDDPPVEEINNKGDKGEKYEFVNHPSHYNEWSMEVIDMMEKIYGIENTIMWCEMTAYKYAMRMGFKPTDDIQQEINKRNWYLNKAKELKQKLN